MSENTITVVGRLVQDPELKFTNSGKAVVKFSLAVDDSWLNRQTNEREKKTSFIYVVAWSPLAENIADSLKKGYRAIVLGKLEQQTYETQAGEKRSNFQIVAEGVGPDLRFVTCAVQAKAEGGAPRAAAPARTYEFDDEGMF